MSKVRPMLGLLIALLIFPSLAPHYLVGPIQKAHASMTTITLYAALAGWNYSKLSGPNPKITLTQGDTVSFSLVSEDSYYPHLLLLDFDHNMVTNDCSGGQDKCSGNIAANGGTGSIAAFVVTATPGMYNYYCLYHSPMYMVGTLVVQSPPGPDYGVSNSPSSLTISQGSNANSTVSVASANGFSGEVTLSATTPASWPTPFFSINPIMVSSGTASTSMLTIYAPVAVSPGPYAITVTASNSSTFSRSVSVPVNVPSPSFAVSANPTSLTINSGSSGTSAITLAGSNGYSGTVNLATTVPSGRGMATLSPPSVTLSSTTTSATSMLTISSPLGTFNVTVTATSGSTSHSISVLVNGPDFIFTASPTSLSVNQGSSATLMLTLSGVNGFTGSVSFSVVPSNGGLTVSLSSNTLQIPATGTVTSTLTVTASSSRAYSTAVPTGSYTIALNATMGSLSHVASIPLTVTSPSFGVGFLTSPLFIGGIIVVVVLVGATMFALSRGPKRSNVR